MPAQFTCDGGCGATTTSEREFTRKGVVKPAWYCPACTETVEAFYQARDALHDEVRKAWDDGLVKLETDWLKEREHGRLPDR
jgi:hypothetical protein